MTTALIEFINSANKLGQISGLKADPKDICSITLFDLCNEHSRAIAHLISVELHGSAMALLRSCIESYIRGLWVYHCVQAFDDVEAYSKKDGKWPKFEKMFKDLESVLDDGELLSERYLGRTYGSLNSMTHGLSVQILKRFDGKTVSLKLSEEELHDILREVCILTYSANLGILLIAENQGTIDELNKLKDKCII